MQAVLTSWVSRFLATCANTGGPQPLGHYAIRRREDGLTTGGLGFHGPVDADGSVSGYGLIPSARGKGYASEALHELLLLARASGATRVKGDAGHNIASQCVMAAAGMGPAVRYFEITWTDRSAHTDPHALAVF
ncbi:GNAT family N-acetyltransferase [Streptomyces sp. NPDC005899]|uniref:GNAT family N-acetyltransferase n=1 Tax=Streptomyces sp. NPDC005899 TaxID=3155716 RepID=UPI0033D9D267